MTFSFSKIFLILLAFMPLTLLAQYDTIHTVQIKGIINTQTAQGTKVLPNAAIKVVGVGKIQANEKGFFEFKLPILDYNRFDQQIEVKLKMEDYQIIRPLNGVFLIDTLDYDLTLDLLAIDEKASDNYKKQVAQLNKRLSRLQKDKTLSVNRLNAINDSLIGRIQANENQKVQLESSIADLESNLQETTAGNKALKTRLKGAQEELQSLQASVEHLNEQLIDALEEKYLRQQQTFKSISADLQDFLIRTKDVHQILQQVDQYFPSSNNPDFVRSYNKILEDYNTILVKINENHDSYIQQVRQYWKNPKISNQVHQTFEVAFDQLHYPRLQPAITKINGLIRMNKKKKAKKVGHETFHELNALILNLEKMINKTMLILKEIE